MSGGMLCVQVPLDSPAMQDETFGPMLIVTSVASMEEAVKYVCARVSSLCVSLSLSLCVCVSVPLSLSVCVSLTHCDDRGVWMVCVCAWCVCPKVCERTTQPA